MTALAVRLAGILGLGLVTYALSELAFYPLAVALSTWEGILAYGFCGWAMVSALHVSGRLDRDGLWLSAGLFGFLVEGVVATEMYFAPPVSLVWTSLGWHAAVTVFGGIVWLGAGLAKGIGPTLVRSALLGLGLGLWGPYIWKGEGGGGLGDYAVQMGLAWIMLAIGHGLWGWAAPRVPALDLRRDAWVLGGIGLLHWAAIWALPFFPVSLSMPVLFALTLLALRGRARDPLAPAPGLPRPLALGATLALPSVAVATFALTYDLPDWEANVVAFLALGLPATFFWGRAVLRGLRRRGD